MSNQGRLFSGSEICLTTVENFSVVRSLVVILVAKTPTQKEQR